MFKDVSGGRKRPRNKIKTSEENISKLRRIIENRTRIKNEDK